jgi:translation initiation factor eIF-2B subunit delta
LIQGVCYLIHKTTKVFIGASSVLSNGAIVGRVGTSMIACIANKSQVPVVAFSETYKFSDRVSLDPLHNNEVGNPRNLVENLL